MLDGIIDDLQQWYRSKCDGIWEHSYGFEINTLDNPSWQVRVTGEASKQPLQLKITNSDDDDWLDIRATATEFEGYGDPHKLKLILDHVKQWLASSSLH